MATTFYRRSLLWNDIRYAREKYSIILIGHNNHDEVIGTFGEAPDSIHVVSTLKDVDALTNLRADRVVYTTQTTLSLDDTRAIVERLKQRFPSIISPPSSDICYATQNRQAAVKAVAEHADLILVVGAENSSNSHRMVEVARGVGVIAYLIESVRDLRAEWLESAMNIGLTAGASTPEILVQEVVQDLVARGFTRVEEVEFIKEDVHFPLPTPLENSRARAALELSRVEPADNSLNVELLAMIRSMFKQQKTDHISSEAIVQALANSEDSPWPDHLPLTKAQLARRLAPFGIRPTIVHRTRNQVRRGYRLNDFQDTFTRYLPAAPSRPGPAKKLV